MTGPLPPSYTCFRCGKQGHWIKNCPTNNPDVKRSTGIPRSFMVPVDGPEHKGALLTSSGDYAVPLIDHQAYKEVKKEKPPFVPQEDPIAEPEAEVPEELLCMFCKDLLQDAVLIPCCGNSFCDEFYDNDEMLVPKNTSVIVARVPVQGGSKKNWDKPDLPLPADDDDLGHIRYDRIVKNADLVNANTSEEDKVKAMITQSSQEYDPSK
ncbi:UNVERIFIED_CONTAM: Rbbp6 [Trichonephila clavipes]